MSQPDTFDPTQDPNRDPSRGVDPNEPDAQPADGDDNQTQRNTEPRR